MKILAAADVHGMRPSYEWLLAAARQHRVAAIILADDLLGCPDGFTTAEAAQRYEAEFVANLPAAAGVPVLYVTRASSTGGGRFMSGNTSPEPMLAAV